MPARQVKHVLCWGLIGRAFQLLRNLLGKTVKPSMCIPDFIRKGTEIGNRFFTFFIFILICKYLGARNKKRTDPYLYSGTFL